MRGAATRGPVLGLALLLAAAPAADASARAPAARAPADSAVAAAPDTARWRWAPVPPPGPGNTAVFRQPERPDWEAALMAPYHILGFPFRVLSFAGNQAVVGLDELGVFDLPPAEYPGLPGPFGTFVMPFLSVESLEGTSVGLDVLRPRLLGDEGNLLHLKGSTSTRQAQTAGLGALFGRDAPWQLQVGGGSEEIQTVRYYGLGHDSRSGDKSYYYRRANWAGLELDRGVGGPFGVELRTYWSKVRARDPRYEVHRALGLVHGDDLPPGYPGESNGWTLRAALRLDSTDQRARPARGRFSSASLSVFRATDGSGLRYLSYRLEHERYYSLWHTGRTLAVRGFFNRIVNGGGAPVPLMRMVTFSAPDELRGVQTLRFYGLGSLGASVEYRWPIHVSRNRDGPGLDAYLFNDTGQVFMRTRDIAWEHLVPTGGFGLRLLGDGGAYLARLEVGWSDEEPVLRFKFTQNFQHDRKVLFDVKDPTRYR